MMAETALCFSPALMVAVAIGLGHEVVAVSKDISDASQLAGELVGIVAAAMKGQAKAVLDLELEMTTPS